MRSAPHQSTIRFGVQPWLRELRPSTEHVRLDVQQTWREKLALNSNRPPKHPPPGFINSLFVENKVTDMLPFIAPFSLLSTLQLASSFDFEAACTLSNLSNTRFSNKTTLFDASLVPAGSTLQFPDADASCAAAPQPIVADMCRITMLVETSESSSINMEAWLPRNWTGRLLSLGNSALGGCIEYEDLAYTSSLGFKAVSANNGHNGTSGAAFENSPQVLADFAYRSVHMGVVIGKELTKAFYGQKHTKSYYSGCSTGGQQGIKSVEDFPEDFDGEPPLSILTPSSLGSAISLPGGETNPYLLQALSGEPSILAAKWFEYAVYNSSFDPKMLTMEDYKYAIRSNPFNIATFKGDVCPFRERGGKVLVYHGQADGLTTPKILERYHEQVQEVSGGDPKDLDEYFRLFRISGMEHCFGGPGAWEIGATGSSALSVDADKNVLVALVKWVERGEGPETIEGVKYFAVQAFL
ncbi:hypothetical protein AAF712_009711 [Marasmius tenuissimus]|uniref:Carboxylic ester hydrolase n=1 Tax=Marasmius tenuissimus TaxID=585030 RepID=A0ABR2ZSU1_9AGAR